MIKELQKQAEGVKGATRVSKGVLKKGERLADLYPSLIKKAKLVDPVHFSVSHGALVMKEKASSTSVLHKLAFTMIHEMTIVAGSLAICFQHTNNAWVMIAENMQELTHWAKCLIHLVEEAAKQSAAVSFPEFHATESAVTSTIEFEKDPVEFKYNPLTYSKKRAMTLQVFDLSQLNLDEEESGKKRERSVEVLSDDD